MDFGEFIGSLTTFDLLVFLFLFGFFVLGFAQGTIRRVLGLASVLFSFLFAANIREPLGQFFADNWRQFPTEYSYLIAFLGVFIVATIAFTITIQGFYQTQPLFEKARFADELIGALLGLLQGVLFFSIAIVILDSFFLVPGIPESDGELIVIRDFWNAMNNAQVTGFFRESVLPIFFALLGIFIPSEIERLVLDNRV